MKKILVTGSSGFIGTGLVPELRKRYCNENVIGTDIREPKGVGNDGPFEKADVTDKEALGKVIVKHGIGTVYHLASLLSAAGEERPDTAWKVNMNGLKNVLDLAREYKLKVFWPSSIAAFGPDTPKDKTPQMTVMDPSTMYGITKVTGELLCKYYFSNYGVDARCLRYPGILSWKTVPGGGTTDYAVKMFHGALKDGKYKCFLKEDTKLPMMYMPDVIKATIGIMEVDSSSIKYRAGYNLAAFSFPPKELADEIRKHVPGFECTYEPDERQKIADSWPNTIDDSCARSDWKWKPDYNLEEMTRDMLGKLGKKFGIKKPF